MSLFSSKPSPDDILRVTEWFDEILAETVKRNSNQIEIRLTKDGREIEVLIHECGSESCAYKGFRRLEKKCLKAFINYIHTRTASMFPPSWSDDREDRMRYYGTFLIFPDQQDGPKARVRIVNGNAAGHFDILIERKIDFKLLASLSDGDMCCDEHGLCDCDL